MIRLIILGICLVLFFILSVPIQLAEYIIQHFNMDFRNRTSLAIVKWALRTACLICGVRVEANGLENIPKDRAVLFVANHRSIFDIITTYPLMKRPTGYVAKKELKKIPFLSWWMYLVNCIFLDRDNPREGLKSILQASEYVKNGVSIFIFPEGTRTKDGNIHEFKEGSMKIATKAKAPIVPVAIMDTEKVFSKHFPFITPTKVTVTFGKPIDTSTLPREEQKHLGKTLRDEVENLL